MDKQLDTLMNLISEISTIADNNEIDDGDSDGWEEIQQIQNYCAKADDIFQQATITVANKVRQILNIIDSIRSTAISLQLAYKDSNRIDDAVAIENNCTQALTSTMINDEGIKK